MRPYAPPSIAILAILCLLSSQAHAGPYQPILPATFPSFTTATGASVMENAGASSGVSGGQVEGITGTFQVL